MPFMRIESNEDYKNDTYTFQSTCLFCKKPSEVKAIPGPQVFAYVSRDEKVQNAFPNMSADDRETLMSGSHGACYDKFMLDPEDDDDIEGED